MSITPLPDNPKKSHHARLTPKWLRTFLQRDVPTETKPNADGEPDPPFAECEGKEHHHAEILVDAWKKMVDVQQHFNDIELKIRNFAVTVFAATFGALAYALEKPSELNIAGFKTPLTTGVIVVALTSWLAFYFMDRWWYHQLLLGSVLQAIDLEKRLAKHFGNDIHLTRRIGEWSPIKYGYPFLVAAMGGVLLVIARQNVVVARGFLGFALAIAMLTYGRYRRTWTPEERFDFSKRSGLNDIVMIGGILIAWLTYKYNLQAAIAILTLAMFTLTNRMARHHKNWRLRSTQKVDLFYIVGFLVLISVGVMLHLSPPRNAAAAAATGANRAQLDGAGTRGATDTTPGAATTAGSGRAGPTGTTGTTGASGTSGATSTTITTGTSGTTRT